MNNIEKTIRLNTLLNIYKELLSMSQKDILEDYYEYDLSISEIAQNRNISRAAVEDALKKGTSKLENLESILHVHEMKTNLQNVIDENKGKNPQFAGIFDEIERIIK